MASGIPTDTDMLSRHFWTITACQTQRDAGASGRIGCRSAFPCPDTRGMSNFRLIDRDTGFLMPPSVDGWRCDRLALGNRNLGAAPGQRDQRVALVFGHRLLLLLI